MKKLISIGISNFKELIENNYKFIDKTLLIKEFIQSPSKIILIPRPRRFGKTLNLSMLKYFFDIHEKSVNLFNNMKIENEKDIIQLINQYPVVFVTLKDQKHKSYENFEEGIKKLMSKLYAEYVYLLESPSLLDIEKSNFREILEQKSSIVKISTALQDLTEYLYKHHNKKVILLIDEYDVPIQEGYVKGYYEDAIMLVRNMLASALKDNDFIEKAMITGILRVSKESIFSGLNNISVEPLTSNNFSDKFGFTQDEVEKVLSYYGIEEDIENIKGWYNGYTFGSTVIYNPWSIVNYIKEPIEGLKPHWINTSANDLIKLLLSKGDEDVKKDLEYLIQGKPIEKVINDNIIMPEIEDSSENIWGFLLFTGYLKATKKEYIEGELLCSLEIPNKEVFIFYKNIIKKWFSDNISNTKYNAMLKALTSGDVESFEYLLKEFVMKSMSYFDISGREPEKVYHAFVLGMLVSLNDDYYVKSNRESGYGRYDVMLIPKNKNMLGIVIEFKKISYFNNNTIEDEIKKALKQIEDMNYKKELLDQDIKNIIEIAIVFKGKEVKVCTR